MWTSEELIAFEQDIANEYNAGQIRAPIHLDGGNEEQLIDIFRMYRSGDWVCGSWRMHYKCLLAGVPPGDLKAAILAGHSITLCFPEYRIVSSAIVGGILPIALGLAWSIKRNGGSEKVWCFLGDMTARTGMQHECYRYARGFNLPITFVIEDNRKSVYTDTQEVWGSENTDYENVRWFAYEHPWPHHGTGKHVPF